jgi:hypothetical protein
LSGNLSFLNWLTIVPALACFDDGYWEKVLPKKLVHKAQLAAMNAEPSRVMTVTSWGVTAVIGVLSIKPAMNLLSEKQIMNTSYSSLELVNTYGAFGTVGGERLNVIFEGTQDENPSDTSDWKSYVYRGLPVMLDKMPPQIAPYQLHLDWQMWFASMASARQYPWTLNLIWKLLHNDAKILDLFANNPFPSKPPRYIRAVLYRYSFAAPGNTQNLWWQREKVREWLPPISTQDAELKKFLKSAGWIE